MPELPEVETVVRGLSPLMTGATIKSVRLNRPDLRFPLPKDFAKRLTGQIFAAPARRAKYIVFATVDPTTNLLAHLGMTGNFRFTNPNEDGAFEKHDHVIFELAGDNIPTPYLVYSDPRRFGFMDLFDDPTQCAFLAHLGPEPLGNQFSAQSLMQSLATKKAPIKSALLDQRIVAGLGNIYVCEALFGAGIDPRAKACDLAAHHPGKVEALARQIIDVLTRAIQSGGSTLQDYKKVDGTTGYFQHHFAVYDREGEPCERPGCTGTVSRIVQSGRSSFFCPVCQSGQG